MECPYLEAVKEKSICHASTTLHCRSMRRGMKINNQLKRRVNK